MRSIGLPIVAILLAGCQATTPATAPSAAPAARTQSTSALAFTPPIARENPEVATARDERADSAFVGFDSVTYTSVYTYQDDRFRFGNAWNGWEVPSQFERRSVQTTVSERTR